MITNTVQLHKGIRFRLDLSKSPRFRNQDIDIAINDAIDTILRNRFVSQGPDDPISGFQRSRILRDELRPLVKMVSLSQRNYIVKSKVGAGSDTLSLIKGYYYRILSLDLLEDIDVLAELISVGAPTSDDEIVLNEEFEALYDTSVTVQSETSIAESKPLLKYDYLNNVLLSDWLPSDYNYYAIIRLTVNDNIKIDPFEITFEQLAQIRTDPFMRPKVSYPPIAYQYESGKGFHFDVANAVVTDIELYYLSRPVKVFYGIEKQISSVVDGTEVILGQRYAVQDGILRNYGDAFIKKGVPSPENTIVLIETVNSDMPESLSREVIEEATKILLLVVEKNDKAKSFQ
jgi:hypothetical protein